MSESPAPGRFNVDVRVFMLTMTVCMCASFFAGVTMGPNPSENVTNVIMAKSPPPPLDLSADVIAQSLEHSAAGQHLLIDISSVDAGFLDSEERLADAMVKTVQETGLTMLSYHCHKLMPAGISCVGVLMESHISFHTWPEEGVITLDLFTCGPYPLLPNAVEAMERLFGIPRSAEEEVRVKWSHELRGFRPENSGAINSVDGYSDLSYSVHSPLDVYSKEQVYSNMTQFHRVDIWDVVELDDSPSHEDGMKHGLKEGDPRWETPELVTPERSLFLNGFLVRSLHNDKEVHEAMVHPAMFAHPNPQHVAIVGGREGGALREVLKHTTIQSALLMEQDEELVKISRKYFPTTSDCSDLVGRAKDCFEDDLVTLSHDDPQAYFTKNYGTPEGSQAGLLDVIIVDEKDPRHFPEFYTNQEFVSSLVKSLSPEGVMVINVGLAPDIDDPRADMGVYFVREQLMQHLESHPGVEAMLVYEESRAGFNDPIAFLVVCKSATCRSRWYARNDQVDFAVYERIVRTHSKERALSYYDGTTQFSYSLPPKAWETVYCRREPTPFECAYLHLDPKKQLYDLDMEDQSMSSFRLESTKNGDGEDKETFVYATVDIPEGSYIMPKHLASSLIVTERNLEGLQSSLNVGGGPVSVIEDLVEFISEHGHESHTPGTAVRFVEIGGTVLIRKVDNPKEANVGRWVPSHPSGKSPVYSPVYERHRVSFDVFLVATKAIPAGTELLRHKGLWNGN